MLRFIDDLLTHLDVGGLRLLYTDTDSYHFALTKSFDELVKDDMRSSWFNNIKPRTFVKNPNDITQTCTPGLNSVFKRHFTF